MNYYRRFRLFFRSVFFRHLRETVVVLLVMCASAVLMSCGASKSIVPPGLTADQLFKRAKEFLEEEEWIPAQKHLDVLKLQFPASPLADDAQYYIAELHFRKREYILSSYNFNQLRKQFPSSEYSKSSLYKAALSYYELSPPADRDQDYTRQAIKSFEEFRTAYPKDSLAIESGKKILELRDKLARNVFSTAELYVKLEAPRSVLVYLDAILNDYPESSLIEQCLAMKSTMLMRVRRYADATEAIRLYRQRFPKGSFQAEIQDTEERIQSGEKKQKEAERKQQELFKQQEQQKQSTSASQTIKQ
jgi:outer membrane protein assembly factor BamD